MHAIDTDDVFVRVRNAAIAIYGEAVWQRAVARDYGYPQSQLSKLNNNQIKLTEDNKEKLATLLVCLEQAETALRQEVALTIAGTVAHDKEPDTLRGKITERFEIVDNLIEGVIGGTIRSAIISGAAGLGKSHGVLALLRKSKKPYYMVTGKMSDLGLYKVLFDNRNGLVLIDDCDGILDREDSMNMIKGATNLDDHYRQVNWESRSSDVFNGTEDERLAEIKRLERDLKHEESRDEPRSARLNQLATRLGRVREQYPSSFSMTGGVIFITNKNWMEMIRNSHKCSEHMLAVIDRGYYLPLGLDTVEMKLERIAQGVEEFGVLDKYGIERSTQGAEIMAFIRENAERFQNLSFRTAEKIAPLLKTSPTRWKRITAISQFGGM